MTSQHLTKKRLGRGRPRPKSSKGQTKPKIGRQRRPADRHLCSACARFDWQRLIHENFNTKLVEERHLCLGVSESRNVKDPKYGGDYIIGRFGTKLETSKYSTMLRTQAICSFCSLAVRALAMSPLQSVSKTLEELMAVDQPVTVFVFLDGLSSDCEIVSVRFPRSEKDFCAVRFTIQHGNDIPTRNLRRQKTFFRMSRPAVNLSCIDLEVVRYWWTDCKHNHLNCRRELLQGGWRPGVHSDSSDFPFRVIDVLRDKVIVPVQGSRYVALSYVWGNITAYRARMRDFVDGQTGEGDESGTSPFLPLSRSQIPKTIQDAMFLVKAIGERYLWVDALCIAQDDPEEVSKIVRVMDRIYENAELTIIAASGGHSDAGIQGLYPGSRDLQPPVTGIVEGVPLLWTEEDTFYTRHMLETSPWFTRGWTYQENQLSRRCLILNKGRVFYDCPSGSRGEARPRSPFQTPLRPQMNSDIPLARASFWVYAAHIERYTKRALSFEGDVLNAFEGIMRQGDNGERNTYCWGLPIRFFRLALMWQNEKLVRLDRENVPASTTLTKALALRRRQISQTDMRTAQFPSWSWSGWKGAIEYASTSYWNPTFRSRYQESWEILCWPWEPEYAIQNVEDVFESGILTVFADSVLVTWDNVCHYLGCGSRHLDDGSLWEGEKECLLLGNRERPWTGLVDVMLLVVQVDKGVYCRQGLLEIPSSRWDPAQHTITRKLIRLG